jgi:hypothetical protein
MGTARDQRRVVVAAAVVDGHDVRGAGGVRHQQIHRDRTRDLFLRKAVREEQIAKLVELAKEGSVPAAKELLTDVYVAY